VKAILLFMLILIPSAAFSQAIYDVSCKNIARVAIYRLKATEWMIKSYGGYYYLLALDLKPDAAQAFGKLLNATPTVTIKYNGVSTQTKNLIITASGGFLRSDIPAMNGLSEQGMLIPLFLKEDAFDAARAVCPALVPAKVIVDWERDWERREYK